MCTACGCKNFEWRSHFFHWNVPRSAANTEEEPMVWESPVACFACQRPFEAFQAISDRNSADKMSQAKSDQNSDDEMFLLLESVGLTRYLSKIICLLKLSNCWISFFRSIHFQWYRHDYFLTMSEENFTKMGVDSFGARWKLLNAIESKNQYNLFFPLVNGLIFYFIRVTPLIAGFGLDTGFQIYVGCQMDRLPFDDTCSLFIAI